MNLIVTHKKGKNIEKGDKMKVRKLNYAWFIGLVLLFAMVIMGGLSCSSRGSGSPPVATTQVAPPPDTTAPVISGVQAMNITASSATITWITDESATSQVEYGTDTNYGTLTTLDSALVTSHSVTISNLTASTTYYYRVRSKDSSGNEAVSGSGSFTTGENIYISQISQGNDSGTDCNNAHSVNWFDTTVNWGNGVGIIGPGDTVHVCGTISTTLTIQGSGTAGNPITIYFEKNAKLSAPIWTGAWWGVEGAIQANNVNYIILDGGTNGVIEATDSGTELEQVGSTGIMFSGVSNSEIKNFYIKNMYVRTSTAGEDGGGVAIRVSSGSNNSIHNNHITETKTAIAYIYPQGGISKNIKIYNNTISRINWGISLGESDVNAKADNISIYSNDIGDMYNWDDPLDHFHHDGIHAFAMAQGDEVTNLKVFNNYIHGAMGIHVTAMIYTEGNVINPIYFNNILVNTGAHGISNGMIRATSKGRIYNNTFIDFIHGADMGIDAASDSDIKNNLFYGNSITWMAPIAIHQPINANTHSDNNLLFNKNGNIEMITFDSTGTGHFYSLSDWRTNFNLDIDSINADPLLMNPKLLNGNYHLQASSPAIDSGINLSSYCTGVPELCFDKDGIPRPQGSAWDIGAYEYCESGNCSKKRITDRETSDN